MTPLLFIVLAIAGGFGAVCRFFLDGFIQTRLSSAMPWGSILINITGSFLLGALTGLFSQAVLPQAVQLIVGTGFLGGYTTFSAASFETIRLIQKRRVLAAMLNGCGVLLFAVAAAATGMWAAASLL